MSDQQLLTLTEAADRLRLQSAETFARFARRHGIPLLKVGARIVRIRASDLERFIEVHTRTLGDETLNTEDGRS